MPLVISILEIFILYRYTLVNYNGTISEIWVKYISFLINNNVIDTWQTD